MKTSILKNTLFSLLIVILFFGSLELCQRVKYYFRTHDESYLFYGATDIELSFAKYFNRLVNRHKRQASTENHEIVIVGGSTVRCDGLSSDLAWPSQLENLIRSDGYKSVTVYNLGKQGSLSTDDVDRLRDFLRTHQPFLVIFCTGINDSASLMAAKVGGSLMFLEDLGAGFPERLNAVLLKHSLFYVTMREKITKVFQKDISASYHVERRKKESFQLVKIDEIGKKRLRSNLLEVIRLTRNLKIDLLFGSPPMAVSPSENASAGFYDDLRCEMDKVSKKNMILYVDIHDKFNLIRDKDRLFFPDKIHVNKYGAEREAQIVCDFLKEHKMLNSISGR